MPICPYFISGKCNYGNKCYNLHVNIGTSIQTTAKASVAGKQWLLSCFAPFEGDTLLPNFIEDQSFDEVRWEYYGARANNRTQLAEQKFNQSWAQASNSMNRLVTMEPIIQSYLADVYGVAANKNAVFPGGTIPSATNPFAAANQSAGTSIFGGATGTTSNNVFGGQLQQQPSANAFGQPPNQPFQLGQMNNNAPTTASSIFGGANSMPATANIFGQSQSSNMFNQAAQQNQMHHQGGVSNMQSTGNIFDQPQPAPVFGQTPQQIQMQSTANIFQQNVFGGSASVMHTAPTQPNTTFGNQPPNPFQNQSPFGQPINANVNPAGFNNLAQNAPQPVESDIFRTPSTNVFSMQANPQPHEPQNPTIYSSVDTLTQEQLLAFTSPEFTLGHIPNNPPPKELCF